MIDMRKLAIDTGLTHDGGYDNRLFDETIFTNSLDLSEKEYQIMEKKLNKFKIKGKGFIVCAWNDISGYDYWTIRVRENNYIQITVVITYKRLIPNYKHIIKAVNKARSEFSIYNAWD